MAKQFSTRIQNKIDIEENWSKATFTPLPGEFIIYAPDKNYSHSRLKIGDGVLSINQLPFVTYSAYDIAKLTDPENTPDTEEEWIESLTGTSIIDIQPIRVSGGNGGRTDIYMFLSDGTSPFVPIYNGHGIDDFEIKESDINGGVTQVDIGISDGRTKQLLIRNGHGINTFSSDFAEGNGRENTVQIGLSNKTEPETLSIYNGHGIDTFNTTQSTKQGEASTIKFKLSNKSTEDTLSVYNGHGLEYFNKEEISKGNGGETKITYKLSNETSPKTFSVYNGEKGDKGTSISSINTTPITDGNGGTKVTISLDDNSEPTNFSIYNGEVSNAQLNSIITNISNDLQLRSKAYSFDKVDDMIAELQRLSIDEIKSQLRIGDVFLIRDIGVPDYWWDPISTEAATIAEYMDKDIIIEGKGACRILETSKLNLSGYCGLDHKKSETDTLSGIKDLSNYKIRIAEDGDEGQKGYITLIIPKEV